MRVHPVVVHVEDIHGHVLGELLEDCDGFLTRAVLELGVEVAVVPGNRDGSAVGRDHREEGRHHRIVDRKGEHDRLHVQELLLEDLRVVQKLGPGLRGLRAAVGVHDSRLLVEVGAVLREVHVELVGHGPEPVRVRGSAAPVPPVDLQHRFGDVLHVEAGIG